MTEREQFEKVFPVPVPDYVTWDNAEQSYMLSGACMNDAKPKRAEMRASAFFNKWSGWQAAKADSAAQVEALQRENESLKAALAGMASGTAVVTFKELKP